MTPLMSDSAMATSTRPTIVASTAPAAAISQGFAAARAEVLRTSSAWRRERGCSTAGVGPKSAVSWGGVARGDAGTTGGAVGAPYPAGGAVGAA